MSTTDLSSYTILFEHNLAMKIMFEYSDKLIGKPIFPIDFNGKKYMSSIEELIFDPINFRGADVFVKTKFRNLENRNELMNSPLSRTVRLIDLLKFHNMENELFEKFGIIYSMVVPPIVDEFDDFINN